MKPPSPPRSPARALRWPSTTVLLLGFDRLAIKVTVPPLPVLPGAASAVIFPVCVMLPEAAKRITPPWLTRPTASKEPLLLTTPPWI